jgi:branched-chain amino acid transport system substrate-binding protein
MVGFLGLTCALTAASAQQRTIKIGMVYPMTGPIAFQGVPMVNAIKQAFDEENYTVAGRKIELLLEDSQGKPDVGLTKFRKLVEKDGVHLLKAEITTTVALAAASYVHSQKVPWVTEAAAGALTRDKRSPYIFLFVPSEYQFSHAPAQWLRDTRGWKKIYWIGWDAAAPRGGFEAFKKVFGNGIVDAIWSPVGTADYGPFLAKVDAQKADGFVVAMWGADAPRITRQVAEYGLKAKLPFFGLASFTSEELLAIMPPEIEGFLSMYNYCGSLNTPANKRFVDGYRARYNALPGSYQYMAYMGSRILIQAIKDVGGNVEDKDSILSALKRVRLDGPMGPAGFDERQRGVFDFYALKVVKKDGQLQNECIDKIPQVKDPYDLFP